MTEPVPDFAVMTRAEILAFSLTAHPLAGVAAHVYQLEMAITRIIDAEYLVRDLVTARNAEQVEAIRERARAYCRQTFGGLPS